MTPFLQLSLALAVLIAAAKIGGYLSYRLGQPSVLGELAAGLVLGPTVLNVLHIPYFSDGHLPEVIHQVAEVGVLLLMFLAGLELHLTDLARTGKVSALAGTLGVIFPLALGTGLGIAFSTSTEEAIFIGLILSATSVSISAQTLMELKALRSRVGISLLGAAVFDDILVVLGLSIFTALAVSESAGGWGDMLAVVLRMGLYLGIGTAVGLAAIPRASARVNRLPVSQGLIAFVIATLLLYGWAAEELGNMAAITGAFLAGLMFARSPVKEHIESGISALAFGLFVPIFFIDVGLKANLRQLTGQSLWLFLAMSVVAILGKIIGSGLGGLMGGLKRSEALQLGIGMMSRGEVGLIVATVGIASRVIPQSIFSAVVGVVIVTTLLTPPLLRWSFHAKRPSTAGSSKETPESGHESGGKR